MDFYQFIVVLFSSLIGVDGNRASPLPLQKTGDEHSPVQALWFNYGGANEDNLLIDKCFSFPVCALLKHVWVIFGKGLCLSIDIVLL